MKKSLPILDKAFFDRPTLVVAEELIGKIISREINGEIFKYTIIETEAYDGPEDLACHASKGRTKRTEVMFGEAGIWYVYLIYGIHWMINIVTGTSDFPAAILIRGVKVGDKNINGPGRVSKLLFVDGSFTGKKADRKTGMWFEEGEIISKDRILQTPRIGIDYAGSIWKEKPWRFVLKD